MPARLPLTVLVCAWTWGFHHAHAATASPSDATLAAFDAGIEAFDQAQQLLSSDPQRARQLFRFAAQQFESIGAAGLKSGPLEYNLGNCYLQVGDTGRAILHYRRALRLMPNDPKLKANLAEARQRCLTSIPPSRERRFLHEVFFWHHQTTSTQRFKASLVFYVLCWSALTIYLLYRRRWFALVVAISGMATAACGASLAVTDWQDRNHPDGVVITMDVAVHKGPGSGYPRQFEQPLQPGTEFTRIGHRRGWWEIELPDGQTGWIDGAAAELVIGNHS